MSESIPAHSDSVHINDISHCIAGVHNRACVCLDGKHFPFLLMLFSPHERARIPACVCVQSFGAKWAISEKSAHDCPFRRDASVHIWLIARAHTAAPCSVPGLSRDRVILCTALVTNTRLCVCSSVCCVHKYCLISRVSARMQRQPSHRATEPLSARPTTRLS